jgi:hypothetical protein
MSSESIAAVNFTPPRVVGTDPDFAVYSAATAAVATSTDIWAGYPLDAGSIRTPPGKIWLELEAVTAALFVRFSRTATTGTTAANGVILSIGAPRAFYVDPTKDLFLDHLATGVGTIKWRKLGPIGERIRA